MFSKTCEYAIRAMIFLAYKSKTGAKTSIRDIAKGIGSPEHFIAKILQQLSKNNMVQSVKGPNGGFYLDKVHLKKSLADIVKVIDGDILFLGCGLGLHECSEKRPCPIHNEFKKVRKEILQMLDNAKLDSFSLKLYQNLAFLTKG